MKYQSCYKELGRRDRYVILEENIKKDTQLLQ